MESLASYHGPESCVGGGNAAREALTGGNAGQPLSSEIKHTGVPTVLTRREGHTARRDRREWRSDPTESKTLSMCGHSMRENRETQQLPASRRASRDGRGRPVAAIPTWTLLGSLTSA